MYSTKLCQYTNDEKAKILDLVLFMNNVPNIEVVLDRTEFRVHFLDFHTHVSICLYNFQMAYKELLDVLSECHKHNTETFTIYTHEELKAKGLNSVDVLMKHQGSMSIISQKDLEEYNEMMNFYLTEHSKLK